MRRRALPLCIAAPATAQPVADFKVNTATRARLEALPDLDPALVQRLLAERLFADWGDLMMRLVPGVKAATAQRMSAAGLRVAGRPWSAAGGEAG